MTDSQAQEANRLAALHRTGILDTPPEETFDRFCRIAANAIDVPVALVSLVDDHRQWFKARLGIDDPETPREIAFCAHAIQNDDPLVVENALEDPRFRSNPLVTGDTHVRFYAGAPIILSGGYRLGTVCVLDTNPRQISEGQRQILVDLAGLAARELEIRAGAAFAEERREIAEERAMSAELVAKEMNHRMGNLFAQVSGLVSMAAREHDSPADLVSAVRERVIALKSVNDLLVEQKFRGASLRDVAEAALAPLIGEKLGETGLVISGDDLPLNDKAAFNIALVLSELGTNALKYGALSDRGGRVSLFWQREGEVLRLVWQESDTGDWGARPPHRQGFGSLLLDRVAPAGLMGQAARRFTEAGYSYELTAKLAHITQEGLLADSVITSS
ncbi:FOG: GGDEF domain protein [Parvularcula bermudensis HTCC2503]|uniref:histidine kinase n=1 Tax=Parvularcula bermudensis (strain ATCC BAA-594 / HTCC2503 / KCTC 12087) TaxID=314260 RepID=E0TBF2_PARBH|nr:GAF domain-containing protein [Parvularcula bermudensis]ADM09749.1 FOG: GGDEF domain protein [Parvularcula bermudensis HTCC2503]